MNLQNKMILGCAGLSQDIDSLKPFLTDFKDDNGEASSAFIRRNVEDRIIGGSWGNLQGYVFSILSREQRAIIYGSGYEPGYPDPIPSDSEKELYNYLQTTYGGSVEDLCKKIKKDIKNLVGIPFLTFLKQDRNQAYKVLTLMYRIYRFRSKLMKLLLSDSTDKCNYEFRSEHPLRESEAKENSAILSEILCHLRFMMSDLEGEKMSKVVETLTCTQSYVANDFLDLYDQISHDPQLYLNSYFALVSSEIQEWSNSLPNPVKKEPPPLHVAHT
ncbi:hypothetical protein [Alteromonas sp. a30]|uniref:hypothetical protein n=1 Tax=Alteromonas sp. a30 TaxID=2730917 RepID=UPI00227DF01C|nr:hypothetical protein [Alteromonas sp. a30]MCY7294975.1 hypothetical protein [Alteromonas sp. a30]